MIAIAIATGQNSAGLDPAASAFIQATGITGELQKAAINNLVLNLKKYNLWSKMKAVYPFVTDNRNLLGYTEDFGNNFWTKTALSVTANTTTAPNGTTTADTLSDGLTNNAHYINTPTSLGINGNNTLSIYAKANTLNFLWIYFYNGSEPAGPAAWFNLSNGTIGTVYSGITANIEDAGNGWYRCSITRNFNFTASFSNCGYGVSEVDNVVSYLGTNKSLFVWGAQLDGAAIPTTYQPIATTQQAYIANQFKYNLKDPRDLDAAFRLVFNGGWTHSSNGATPNGVNAYADTFYNPSVSGQLNSAHLSYYSRTNSNGTEVEIGVERPITNFQLLEIRTAGLTYFYMNQGGGLGIADANSLGYYIGNRTASNVVNGFKNGTKINNASTSSILLPNAKIYLAAYNQSNNTAAAFSTKQSAFATIGDGLTDTEAANLYTRVQAYQTALSRQV
jgi:hypothetical protein